MFPIKGFAVGNRIFPEYEEAVSYCEYFMKRKFVYCIRETGNKATHRYLGNGKIESINTSLPSDVKGEHYDKNRI